MSQSFTSDCDTVKSVRVGSLYLTTTTLLGCPVNVCSSKPVFRSQAFAERSKELKTNIKRYNKYPDRST